MGSDAQSWKRKVLERKHSAPSPAATELKVLSPDQMMALLRAAKQRSPLDYALLAAGYELGLRSSEPGLMEMDDLNLGAGTIKVFRVKRSRYLSYPLAPRVLLSDALRDYIPYRACFGIDASPWLFPGTHRCSSGPKHPHGFYLTGQGVSRDTCQRRYQYYLVAALGDVGRRILETERSGRNRWHTLKHSLGTHLANAGATLSEINLALGHASAKSSLVYMGHASEDTSRETDRRMQEMVTSFRERTG